MRVQFYSKGPIDQVSGGYIYNRKVIEQLLHRGIDVSYHPDPGTLRDVCRDDTVIVDSLIIAACLPLLLTLPVTPILLMHMDPRAIEPAESTNNDEDQQLARLLRQARMIATGAGTRDVLRETAGSQLNIAVIEPGVPFDGTYQRQYAGTASRLLSLANYVPGKGHLQLLEVLCTLQHLEWTIRLHGNHTFMPDYYEMLCREVIATGLQDRIEIGHSIAHAEVEQALASSDLLLQFSTAESYSMATAEAIACGLPVLATRTGNWQHFATSGLLEFVPGDAPAETAAQLGDLIGDAARYGQLRPRPGWQNRGWEDVGNEFLAWLENAA